MVCLTRFDFSGALAASLKQLPEQRNQKQPRVVMFGEAVALLQAEGNADAAIRFEQLGNDLPKAHKVDILCAYSLRSFHGKEDEHAFQSICEQHSAVYSQ